MPTMTIEKQERRVTSANVRKLTRVHRELGERALTVRDVSPKALENSWDEAKVALDAVYKERIVVTGFRRADRVRAITSMMPTYDGFGLEMPSMPVDETHAQTLIGKEVSVVYYMPLDLSNEEFASEPKRGEEAAAHMVYMLCRDPELMEQDWPSVRESPACFVPCEDLQWRYAAAN